MTQVVWALLWVLLIGILCSIAHDRGRASAQKEIAQQPNRCHAYEAFIKDWVKKNQVIHRLETRIFRLKRANRNLRKGDSNA